jgi:ankyrin repeat protein
MHTRVTVLAFACVTALALVARPAAAEEEKTPPSPILKALFRNNGGAFTDPARNEELQALLAKKPPLSFFEACGVGNVEAMTQHLGRDPKLATAWIDFGWSALHLAAFSGSVQAVLLLIDRGADVNARARTKFRNTPLQAGLLSGQYEVTKLLLSRGADPLVRQAAGIPAIQEAAVLGRRDLVDLLLENGAEINSRADDGRTAVTEALRAKHQGLAEYLKSKGGTSADITADMTAEPK